MSFNADKDEKGHESPPKRMSESAQLLYTVLFFFVAIAGFIQGIHGLVTERLVIEGGYRRLFNLNARGLDAQIGSVGILLFSVSFVLMMVYFIGHPESIKFRRLWMFTGALVLFGSGLILFAKLSS